MPFTTNPKNSAKSYEELFKTLGKNQDQGIQEILSVMKEMFKKMDEQSKLITKIAVAVSQLHGQGQLNEETFNKLDGYLKIYYDQSNLEKDY